MLESRHTDEFKTEFSLRNFLFEFNIIGESKQVFVQSKIKCISPSVILTFRLFAVAYLLFASILSVTSHQEKHSWIIYMTSWNYILVIVYFMCGLVLSCYAVFFNLDYHMENGSGRSTLRRFPPSKQRAGKCNKNSHKLSNLARNQENKNGTGCGDCISTKSSSNGSTSELIDSMKNRGYSVDSILFDIEENSKRLSVAHSAKTMELELHHARLQDNRLPSVSSDVFHKTTFHDLNFFLKIYWLISCIVLNLTLIIVTVYWVALFRNALDNSVLKWYLRVDRHGIVALLVLLDYMMIRTPTRILHFIYPAMINVAYGVANGLYCSFTGKIVYSRLDFLGRPYRSIALILLGAFVLVPIFQFVIYWCCYRVKKKIFK